MKNKQILIPIVAALLVITACKKNDFKSERTRLFRPVPNGSLTADSNAILANWLQIKDVSSYTIQLSKDTFRTILVSRDLPDTGSYLFTNLDWDKLYQVQVRANAADTVFNSRFSNLGSIRTARFPTILKIPLPGEITDEAVRVSWVTGGAAVTSIKILKASDSSVVTTVALTPTDVTDQFKIISGLTSATSYIIFLYSGTSVRGWADFITNAPLSGVIIDLRGITGRPSILADTIPIIPSGSTVLLKRGQTYNIAAAVNLGKAITITSGDDLVVPEQAKIYFTSNFNFTAGSVIDYIDFKDVYLSSDNYGSRYVFNTTASANVERISFDNCKMEIFRGICRLQSGTTIVTNFLVNNCIIDSVSNYGVLTVDNTTCAAGNVSIKNSTIYRVEKVITSAKQTAGSISVVIDNCTVNEAPLGNSTGSFIVDYNTFNVTNGIIISNCIFGKGKPNVGNILVRDVRAGAATSISSSNNFITFDHTTTANPLSPVNNYAGTSVALWVDPYNGNFRFADGNFTGRTTSGDPRWRP